MAFRKKQQHRRTTHLPQRVVWRELHDQLHRPVVHRVDRHHLSDGGANADGHVVSVAAAGLGDGGGLLRPQRRGDGGHGVPLDRGGGAAVGAPVPPLADLQQEQTLFKRSAAGFEKVLIVW